MKSHVTWQSGVHYASLCARHAVQHTHTVTALNSPAESHFYRTLSSLRSFLLLVQLPYKLEDRRRNLQSCVRVKNSPSCCTPTNPPPPNCRDPQGPIHPPCLCISTLHRRPCCLSCYTVILTISLSGWIWHFGVGDVEVEENKVSVWYRLASSAASLWEEGKARNQFEVTPSCCSVSPSSGWWRWNFFYPSTSKLSPCSVFSVFECVRSTFGPTCLVCWKCTLLTSPLFFTVCNLFHTHTHTNALWLLHFSSSSSFYSCSPSSLS